MQILTGACHPRALKPAHDHGGHHPKPDPHHGKSLVPMSAVHVAHDVAMIGMSIPGLGNGHGGHSGHTGQLPPAVICGSAPQPAPVDHSHHHGHHGHDTPQVDQVNVGGALNGGLAVLSAAAAAGATYHGVRMLGHGHYAHGANHLLMGAGSATMALAMATNSHGLHQASSVLMGAHGLMEVGLGVQSFLKAESGKEKALAATTAVHGACLAGAQVAGSALAFPLYLGMGAATVAQLILN